MKVRKKYDVKQERMAINKIERENERKRDRKRKEK